MHPPHLLHRRPERMMRRRLLLLPARCIAPRGPAGCPRTPPRWFSTSSARSGKQDWRQAVAAFQHQVRDATTPLRPASVRELVQLCAANDRPREALDVIRRGKQRGVEIPVAVHIQVCCALARKGSADRALAMLPELHARFNEQFKKDGPRVYDPLLTVFKTQGDWRSTHATIAQMHELGISPPLRAFRVLMVTAAKARRKDTLLTTLAFVEKQFPESQRDVHTLTAMSQALVDAGELQRALELYRKLDSDWLLEHGSTMLFNQFLLAASRDESDLGSTKGKKKKKKKNNNTKNNASGMQVAQEIFNRMQQAKNAAPDDFTFATCMLGLEKRGQWSEVLDLFSIMLDVQARLDSAPNNKTSVINALACSSAIRALHLLHKQQVVNEEQQHQDGDATADDAPRRSLLMWRSVQRQMKKDLSVVLKQLPTVDLRHLGHASTLIDTLDEFCLFTAARQTFERLLSEGVIKKTPWCQKDGFEIDLHTFSRGVAKCAVVSAFEEITRSQEGSSEVSLAGNAPLQDLRIITGVGNRSQTRMQPVLKREVKELLTHSTRPPLWATTHPTNPGVLLVRQNALRKWLRKGGSIRYF